GTSLLCARVLFCLVFIFLFIVILRPPRSSTLFPYTTRFRSLLLCAIRGLLLKDSHVFRCGQTKKGLQVLPPWPITGSGVTVIGIDRKSTRLNSSHVKISYAVFCLKKKKKKECVTATHLSRTS